MTLRALGFDAWFEERARDACRPGLRPARVTVVDRGGCLLRDEGGELPAELAGRLRFAAASAGDLPCVGDWVCIDRSDAASPAIIHRVLPRRTFLRRKRAGRDVDFQMIAANIDTAFIVQACHFDYNPRRLDRYLVMANEGGIEPVLILSKTDLVGPGELERKLEEIGRTSGGIATLALSNTTGAGFDAFRQGLQPGRTYCLLGSSGVGKTTLINNLLGRAAFGTKSVSGTGEGTHATSRRQLIVLEQGAMLIDTPGMRELGILGAAEGLDDSFADIVELAPHCRFADCRHDSEPGCAVLRAVEGGELSRERYGSYRKLRAESDHNEMSYVDRRRKDRAFGRLIKSVLKHKPR